MAAALVVVGLLVGMLVPLISAAEARASGAAPVKIRAHFARPSYQVGQRPVLRVEVSAKRHGHSAAVSGKVVVTLLGRSSKATVRHGRAKVRLARLTRSGRAAVRIAFDGRGVQASLTKTLVVRPAPKPWQVPDPELRAEIRSALRLPARHHLTLADASHLNNRNGASLFFGSVRTAAGLERATHLTRLSSFTAAEAQDSRGLGNIKRVDGDFWISNAVQNALYPRLRYIGGELVAFNTEAEHIQSISLPVLEDAGQVSIEQRDQLASISLPRLANVRGDVEIESEPALVSVDLPALAAVSGDLAIGDLDNATAVRLPALRDVAGMIVKDSPRVTTLALDHLATVEGWLQVSGLPDLTALEMPELLHVDGDLTLYQLAAITSFRLPVLQWSHGNVTFGIGDDFPALPSNGQAVSVPAFDVDQATNFDFEVKGASASGDTLAQRWQEFCDHYGVG